MANLFRFWVGCRKTSNPECIVGEDKLGGELVDDPNSVFHNTVPMPVIMIAQMECILYTKVLRPTHLRLLKQLNDLVQANKREYWLTIYLSMFILLHSCAMVSRRDWETARQYGLKVGRVDLFRHLSHTLNNSNPNRKSTATKKASPSIKWGPTYCWLTSIMSTKGSNPSV